MLEQSPEFFSFFPSVLFLLFLSPPNSYSPHRVFSPKLVLVFFFFFFHVEKMNFSNAFDGIVPFVVCGNPPSSFPFFPSPSSAHPLFLVLCIFFPEKFWTDRFSFFFSFFPHVLYFHSFSFFCSVVRGRRTLLSPFDSL